VPARPVVSLAGQLLQRTPKVEPLKLHREVEDVATTVASEAMPALTIREDVERRGLLRMEGAEALEVSTGFLELHVPADEIGDIEAFLDFVDNIHVCTLT